MSLLDQTGDLFMAQDEQDEQSVLEIGFFRSCTEPANSFSAYHSHEEQVVKAWPFHERGEEDIETADTTDHSASSSEATPTPPPEPSAEFSSKWDQNLASNSAVGGHYFVPYMISSPFVPEQVPSPNFIAPSPMGCGQGQLLSQTPPSDWGTTTTVMMRNLANKYTQSLLLTEINEAGFVGTYDFLYLPIDTDTNANKGYAFINFSEPGFAWMFKQAFEGQRMQMFNSDKVVSVFAATLQGFDNNHAHYVNARCNRGDPACRPLFLRAPSHAVTTKPMARSGRRNGRGQGRSNLDRLAEMQHIQQQLEQAVQSMMTKQLAEQSSQPQQEQQQQQQQQQLQMQESQEPQMQHTKQFCPHCGTKANTHFKFCPGCGSSLTLV